MYLSIIYSKDSVEFPKIKYSFNTMKNELFELKTSPNKLETSALSIILLIV